MPHASFEIVGHTPLGFQGRDGIRYAWSTGTYSHLVESAAFTRRTALPTDQYDNSIAAYTVSVSSGCILSAGHTHCRFCRTGSLLRFHRLLTPEEIALQNVFMTIHDMRCPDFPELATRPKEFAYMGQGEPGFSYPQLRHAIHLTSLAMNALGQTTHRHLIATVGIPEMLYALADDIEHGFFSDTRITTHFSLHATQNRSALMPINDICHYSASLPPLKRLFDLTGEKPCIGILVFNDFSATKGPHHISSSLRELQTIAAILDPGVVRISLVEYNPIPNVTQNQDTSHETLTAFRQIFVQRGFETKLFASFGREEDTACGLLAGVPPAFPAGPNMMESFNQASTLVSDCKGAWHE